MKKISVLFLAAIAFFVSSCGSFLSDIKSEDERMYNLFSNVVFDSLSLKLTADTLAVDGTVITARCNGSTISGVAGNGRIEFVLDTSFHEGILGGRSYEVDFNARGFMEKKEFVEYWPKARFEVTSSLDRGQVFKGGAQDFEVPEINLKNYDEGSVSSNISYRLWENYDVDSKNELDVDTSAWEIDDLRAFFSDAANVGKTVEIWYTVAPNCANAEEITEQYFITYDCKNDVSVGYAEIRYEYGAFRLYLYDNSGSNPHPAGGALAYQWQVSDDPNDNDGWTDIQGATQETYMMTEADLGKFIRGKITQTLNGVPQTPVFSESDEMTNKICDYSLYYDGFLTVGDVFDTAKIRGTITDSFGRTYDAQTCTWETVDVANYYTANELDGSKYFIFSVCFEGDDPNNVHNADVFATVRYAPLEELPELSTDRDNISYGCVEFTESNGDIEVSADNGASYSEISIDEIWLNSNRKLYIRKKASGMPYCGGYLKESEPVCLDVTNENIGNRTLTPGEGIINGIALPEMTLEKSVQGNVVVVTPRITNTESFYTYKYSWFIDGAQLSESTEYNDDIPIRTNGSALEMDRTKLPKDTYEVFCIVAISGEDIEGTLISLSGQTSVIIQ